MGRLTPTSGIAAGGWRRLLLAVAAVAAVSTGAVAGTSVAGASSGSPTSSGSSFTAGINLAGTVINFGDQLKEYQTVVAATGTLNGAPYSVNWSNFIGGPPIIAAEVGGSVDLGDMAETPTIFAQAAGDPVKVVGVTEGTGTNSAYGVMVPKGSSIKNASELRGKTIAVQEGTVEQYVLLRVLQAAGIPYGDVTVENLTVTAGEAALTSGKVDAWIGTQPFIALVTQKGEGSLIPSAASTTKILGYLTAPVSSLQNPKKAAAIGDFIVRLYKSQAQLRKDPALAARTYASTYGVPLSVAEAAVRSTNVVPTPVTTSILRYQQQEANAFLKLGLIPHQINVAQIFDTSLNRKILAAYLKSG